MIAEWYNYEELIKCAKVRDQGKRHCHRSPRLKDSGSPASELTPAARACMQIIIDNVRGRFVDSPRPGWRWKTTTFPAARRKMWTVNRLFRSSPCTRSVIFGSPENAQLSLLKSVAYKLWCGAKSTARASSTYELATFPSTSPTLPSPRRPTPAAINCGSSRFGTLGCTEVQQ